MPLLIQSVITCITLFISFFAANKSEFPELSPAMVKKLRQLTVVSLATKNKCLPYSLLLKELELRNLRELEVRIYMSSHAFSLSIVLLLFVWGALSSQRCYINFVDAVFEIRSLPFNLTEINSENKMN